MILRSKTSIIGSHANHLSAWHKYADLTKLVAECGSDKQAEGMEKKWWTLVVVCAATFMLLLDITIVIVALPTIQSELHASFSDVQWVVDAYALTLASVLLTAGSLADRYGRRLLFTIGLIVFTLGSLLCGIAQSPIMLILSRSAQGIGGAILFATSLALLAQSFHGKDRGMAFGIWGAVTGVAAGLGPVLGGVITTGISWRGIFLVNLPVGVAALVVTRWQVDESKTPHASRPDWAGFVTLTAGLDQLGLRPDPRWRDGLERYRSRYLSRPRRCVLRCVRCAGAPSRPPAVRPVALPYPHLQRWIGCGLCHERFALRDVLVPRPLSPRRPRLLRFDDWYSDTAH